NLPDLWGRDAFARKVSDCSRSWSKKKARNMVGDDAVDLFRHASIEGPQPRLNMGNRNVKLGRRQRARQSRICITVHQCPVRPLISQNGFDCGQHSTSLFTVGARSNLKVVSRPGNLEFVEEDLRHVFVIMLAGVNDELANT